jgi:diguanylate cyclase (GGDEF)-like protein
VIPRIPTGVVEPLFQPESRGVDHQIVAGLQRSGEASPDLQSDTQIVKTEALRTGREEEELHVLRVNGAHDAQAEYATWRRHLIMGIGSFTMGAALLFVYLLLTPHGPHRGLLEAIDAAGIGCWLAIFAPVGASALQTRWRVPFFFIWSVTTLAFIAAGSGLDGGIESPITGMLVLPVLFAALVYPLTAVIILVLVAESFFTIIAVTGPMLSSSRVATTGVSLGLAGGIAVMATVNRNSQERDRQRLTARLHKLATRDGLTGCLNYQAFQDAIEVEIARARRSGRPFSVVMADLDAFKEINDAHGHEGGDVTLRSIAQALLAGARTTDVVGRLGGDEFAVLLPETDVLQVRHIAERFQAYARSAKTPAEVTVSFGAATWSDQCESPAEVIRKADQALYSAKHAGRDQLVVWNRECRASTDTSTAATVYSGS